MKQARRWVGSVRVVRGAACGAGVVVALAFSGCSDSGTNGNAIPASGGAFATGGFVGTGAATTATGGVTATGGASGSGGTATGGASGSGGTATGGASGSGGTATGGASGSGGSGGSPEAGSACANPGNGLDPAVFPVCPTCTDKPAHCVPTTVVNNIAPDQISQLTPCDDTSVCVPDTFITTMGKYDPPACSSISGGAGRCLSTCIGAVSSLGKFLPKDTCKDDELCAPCVDPRTGATTGACSLQCDSGPVEPKIVFSRCCSDDSGICIPPTLVDATQAKALAQGTKCETGTLCAPEKFADTTFVPKTCNSVADAEGRCLSTCVDLVGKLTELLPKDVCAEGEKCAPCTDPRSGELTGACSLNGDSPKKDPVIFDTECCAGTGLCVPLTAVPDRYSKLLPADVCAGDGSPANYVCAPKLKLADLSAPLPKCQVLLLGIPVPAGDPNQFGACIPQCIADSQIAANPLNSLGLAQSDCQPGWLCAPCTNPLAAGARTGACD